MVLDSSPLLLVVDRDRDFTHSLAAEAAVNNFQTAIAKRCPLASLQLHQIFQIRNTSTQNSPIDSLDLLAQLHQQMPSLPIVVIVPGEHN